MRERTITVGPILKVEARVPRVAKVGEELTIEFFIFNDGIAQEDINLDVMANRNFEFVNEVGFPVSFSTFGTFGKISLLYFSTLPAPRSPFHATFRPDPTRKFRFRSASLASVRSKSASSALTSSILSH